MIVFVGARYKHVRRRALIYPRRRALIYPEHDRARSNIKFQIPTSLTVSQPGRPVPFHHPPVTHLSPVLSPTAAMGIWKSKLTPGQLVDLEKNTHCKPLPLLPHSRHSVQAPDHLPLQSTRRNSRPGKYFPPTPFPIRVFTPFPDPPLHIGTRASYEIFRVASSTRKNSAASTSSSSALAIRASSQTTSSSYSTRTAMAQSTLRSSSARSPSPREASSTKSSNVRVPRLPTAASPQRCASLSRRGAEPCSANGLVSPWHHPTAHQFT